MLTVIVKYRPELTIAFAPGTRTDLVLMQCFEIGNDGAVPWGANPVTDEAIVKDKQKNVNVVEIIAEVSAGL